MKKLWNHQKYAVEKYKDRPFFGLLFDMGLGKTLTAIKIAEEKIDQFLLLLPMHYVSNGLKKLKRIKKKTGVYLFVQVKLKIQRSSKINLMSFVLSRIELC